jgi:hypothetical protein
MMNSDSEIMDSFGSWHFLAQDSAREIKSQNAET